MKRLEKVAECDRTELRVFLLPLGLLTPKDVGERSQKMPVAYSHADSGRRNKEILVHAGAIFESVPVEGDVPQDQTDQATTLNGKAPIGVRFRILTPAWRRQITHATHQCWAEIIRDVIARSQASADLTFGEEVAQQATCIR